MNTISPFWSTEEPCDATLRTTIQRLSARGLRALRTFDLHDARRAISDCPCPHHGTMHCDCQMVVLLVYGQSALPATLILHGNDGRSSLSLVNTPAQRADASLWEAIQLALQINPSKEGL